MEWVAIITMIIDLIAQCREDRDREEIEMGLRNPRGREVLALRRVLRREQKLKGKALRAATREGIDYLKTVGTDEISALMDEAEAIYVAAHPGG